MNIVNLLLLQKTFLKQKLLDIELEKLSKSNDTIDRCTKSINLLDDVISLIEDATSLLELLVEVEKGDMFETLADLLEEAQEVRGACQDLLNNNNAQSTNQERTTLEERANKAEDIANRALTEIRNLEEQSLLINNSQQLVLNRQT